MPIQAANAVKVLSDWSAAAKFIWPIPDKLPTKLDVFVNGADVIVQPSEDPNATFLTDQSQEILLRQGFNSREFVTPFTAVRFKIWPLTTLPGPVTCDITIYS